VLQRRSRTNRFALRYLATGINGQSLDMALHFLSPLLCIIDGEQAQIDENDA
jgi:hypothetical protein